MGVTTYLLNGMILQVVQVLFSGEHQDSAPDKPLTVTYTGWWFQTCFFSSLPWEMIQFDEHIFQMGWFNHQLVRDYNNKGPY